MINKKKIILMAKIQTYLNSEGKKDLTSNRFFKFDYISKNNLKNSILIACATTLLLLLNIFKFIIENKVDFLKIDYVSMGKELVYTVIFVLIFYNIIGYIKYGFEYSSRKKRVDIYLNDLENLNKIIDCQNNNKRKKIKDEMA